MNSLLKEKIDAYIASFLADGTIKQYFALEEEISSSEEIASLQERLKKAQKNLALSVNDNRLHEENLKIYLCLKEEFENHPLVTNYNVLREEIYSRLRKLQEDLK